MKRLTTMLVSMSLVLLVAACSGSGGESTPDLTGASDATRSSTSNSSAASSSGAAARARVTIGGERWEFDLTGDFAKCIAQSGALGALGSASDGTSVTVAIELPPVDWQTSVVTSWAPPSVQVNDKVNGRDWRSGDRIAGPLLASAGLDEAAIAVTDFSIDGGAAQGSAVFVDVIAVEAAKTAGAAPPDPVTGTFEVNCN